MMKNNMENNIKETLKKILGDDAYNFGSMQVTDRVKGLSRAIYYLTGQMSMLTIYVPDDDKEYFKETIEIIFKNTNGILTDDCFKKENDI